MTSCRILESATIRSCVVCGFHYRVLTPRFPICWKKQKWIFFRGQDGTHPPQLWFIAVACVCASQSFRNGRVLGIWLLRNADAFTHAHLEECISPQTNHVSPISLLDAPVLLLNLTALITNQQDGSPSLERDNPSGRNCAAHCASYSAKSSVLSYRGLLACDIFWPFYLQRCEELLPFGPLLYETDTNCRMLIQLTEL